MNTIAQDLRTIALHWNGLREGASRPLASAPSASGSAASSPASKPASKDIERAEVGYDRAHAAHRRSQERDLIQLGERPTPVRLQVLDTMRVVEAPSARAPTTSPVLHSAPISVPAARKAD
ncbi:hypothetical protein [Streptomyces sp. NPDC057280]|uniref:hypothetical protein n=1 Tax=Streptomyces sp. NPDC057280 TaxID=3346081 RepID=UPI0036375CEC